MAILQEEGMEWLSCRRKGQNDYLAGGLSRYPASESGPVLAVLQTLPQVVITIYIPTTHTAPTAPTSNTPIAPTYNLAYSSHLTSTCNITPTHITAPPEGHVLRFLLSTFEGPFFKMRVRIKTLLILTMF